ncbi:hypothetical protein HMPREF0971_03279 [Segatella oris F0302]|uniref:Uncharacterized protein n=1 Tax=Segatella oris F0302 TaxID=649760 RepID=D1QW84_9BACT|nr:hypothetical protein HMPREF0971_03279 [Segatella oris F0302]
MENDNISCAFMIFMVLNIIIFVFYVYLCTISNITIFNIWKRKSLVLSIL